MQPVNPFNNQRWLIVVASIVAAAIVIAMLATGTTAWAQSNPQKAPVTGLSATPGSNPGEIDVTWDAHPAGARDYRVAWKPDGERFRPASDTDWNAKPTATGMTISGLTGGDDYKVKVRARFDSNPRSRWSSVATATAASGSHPPEPTPENTPATGLPTVTGTPQSGETLTADTSGISDPNGLTNPQFTYQWIRSAQGKDTDIWGFTAETYTATDSDIGKAIKVRVTFSDDDGYTENLPSAATAQVSSPPTEDDDNGDMARNHETDSVTITYHGNAEERVSNVAVVRRDHMDVHITWSKPEVPVRAYALYRKWNGANARGILCLYKGMPGAFTSYTDTSVASYHPGGQEAKYEYRLYSMNGDTNFSNTTKGCDRNSWPTDASGQAADYVKLSIPVNHHEDVYAASNTGPVQHHDVNVPSITSVTLTSGKGTSTYGEGIKIEWNSIPYSPGYRVQYKKTSEADTEWKDVYEFRWLEFRYRSEQSDVGDNCTGNPSFTNDGRGVLAKERGPGTWIGGAPTGAGGTGRCKRTNYPTDQVGHRWPPYWGADGHDTRHAPTRFTLQRVDADTQYDIRVAMCSELEDSSRRGLQVCAAIGDYSAKRTIRSAQ